MTKKIILLTIALCFTLTSSLLAADRARGLTIGAKAPLFTFPDKYGNLVSLQSYTGKKVVLFFWVSWCTCRDQLPLLQKFRDARPSKDYEILSVSIDAQGTRYVTPIVDLAGVKFPVLLDSRAETARDYHFPATPAAFLIDEAGTLKKQYLPEFDLAKEATQKELEAFLAEKPVDAPKAETAPTPDDIIKGLEKKVADAPGDTETRRKLAGLLTDKGDAAAALPQWDALVKSKGAKCEDKFSLGAAHYRLGHKEDALKYWKAAHKCDQTNYIYMRTVQSLETPDQFYTKEKMGALFPGK